MSRPTARPLGPSVGGGLVGCFGGAVWFMFWVLMINRRRGRTAVNRSQAGIRSRRRSARGGGAAPGLLSVRSTRVHPMAQSAKTGSNPTAAHGLSAARFLSGMGVLQFPQKPSSTRPRFLSIFSFTPTYPQRTGAAVTAPASGLRLSPAMQGPRQPRRSLSLGSLGGCYAHL
jgi:hypothetical protein